VVVERPLDLYRHLKYAFGLTHQPSKRGCLSGFEARRPRKRLRYRLGQHARVMHASFTMMLAPALHRSHKPGPGKHDPVRDYLALVDCGL